MFVPVSELVLYVLSYNGVDVSAIFSGFDTNGILLTATFSVSRLIVVGETVDVVYPALIIGLMYVFILSRAVELLKELVPLFHIH